MTGFAALSQELPAGTLSAEVRSVNHRYLDLTFRLPDELRAFEPALREQFSVRLTRGKVECRIGFQKNANGMLAPEINSGLLHQLSALDLQVRELLPGAAPLSVNDVLRWPGMLRHRYAAAGGIARAGAGAGGPGTG